MDREFSTTVHKFKLCRTLSTVRRLTLKRRISLLAERVVYSYSNGLFSFGFDPRVFRTFSYTGSLTDGGLTLNIVTALTYEAAEGESRRPSRAPRQGKFPMRARPAV